MHWNWKRIQFDLVNLPTYDRCVFFKAVEVEVSWCGCSTKYEFLLAFCHKVLHLLWKNQLKYFVNISKTLCNQLNLMEEIKLCDKYLSSWHIFPYIEVQTSSWVVCIPKLSNHPSCFSIPYTHSNHSLSLHVPFSHSGPMLTFIPDSLRSGTH